MDTQIRNRIVFIIVLAIFTGLLIYSPIAQAQYWANLPPYNTLWPLWSPALSPIDDITGQPVPIVDSLASSTILPVAPGLTWDPSFPYPWLLYNTAASGLAYYDPFTGINPWPAPYLQDDVGLPLPISLPNDFASLSPIDYGAISWLLTNLPIANNAFSLSPLGLWAPKTDWYLPPFIDYLSPLDIIGPTLGAGIVPAALLPPPVIPPPIIPIPTIPVPTLLLGTAPLPTIPIPIAPLPTIPVPTLLLGTAPLPTIPIPIAPLPTIPVPTLLVGTAPLPTIPVPIAPLPTALIPAAPLPTITVPVAPLPTAPIPTVPLPTITVPTAAVSGLFYFW